MMDKQTKKEIEKKIENLRLKLSEFFEKKNTPIRVIYRTSSEKFNDSPHNLLPKKLNPNRLTIMLDFKDTNISEKNIKRIIAIPEKMGGELQIKYPLSNPKFSSPKIDLDKLPKKYVYKNIRELMDNSRELIDEITL